MPALPTGRTRMVALREKKRCLQQEKTQLARLSTELRGRALWTETWGSFFSTSTFAGGILGNVSTGVASVGAFPATSVALAGAVKEACA